MAPSGYRWAARLIDGGLVAICTMAWMAVGLISVDDPGVVIVLTVLGYLASLVFFGVLYGCMASPGQAMAGVVSLRAWTGRRVGVWRGAWRYIGAGLLPLWVILFLVDAFSNGGAADVGYSEPVRVVFRRA